MRRFTLVFADRDFRWFAAGFATSQLGSNMAPVATAFAGLSIGGADTAGLLMAVRILPVVLFLLLGGVLADRLGSRKVMIAADIVRCVGQAAFGWLLVGGRPTLGMLLTVVAAAGIGEGVFTPSLPALMPQVVGRERLTDANALLNMATSVAQIAGPVLGGLVAATMGPPVILFADAVTYAVSVAVLLRLKVLRPPRGRRSSFVGDLRQGWAQFASRPWLWASTLQFCLFNAFVWAPFLVLGPLVAQLRLGGPSAWGVILAANGTGAVLGALSITGREPRRPMLIAMALTSGYAIPPAALAVGVGAPLAATCVGVLLAGAMSGISGTLSAATTQRRIPTETLGRISAWQTAGAFALGPLGLAVAGPLGSLVGIRSFLAFGAVWQVATVALMLATPSIRAVRVEIDQPTETIALTEA
jgi:MFS family permease